MAPSTAFAPVSMLPARPAPYPMALPTGLYAELKQRVVRAGLLERQPLYYCRVIAVTFVLAAIGLAVLISTRNPWLQLANAAYLAVVFTQFSFLGHDTGHFQIVRSGRMYTLLTLLFGSLLTGISPTWWKSKHDPHHSHPNRTDYDPNIMLALVAFSTARARSLSGFQRVVVRRQHLLFPFMLLLEAVVLRFSSASYLIATRGPRWGLELLLLAAHVGIYTFVLVHFLGIWPAVGFITVHQLLYGFYLGSVFAPNHKGMPVYEDDGPEDFLLKQVLTARNVAPNALVDFVYGGLNYQIEHHLFPTMPRNRLHLAQPLVRSFCAEHSIPYCQTTAVQAYRAIFNHLRSVGESLPAGPQSILLR
ncbi:MAG: fatty acid desaturase family protein [Dehalococcoidia bacterium]